MSFMIKKVLAKTMENMARMAYKPECKPIGMEILENVAYIQDGTKEHMLDIYYPPEKQNQYPTIINIHGGAFCMNSKELIYRNYGMKLASNQFAVININYRLAPKNVYPAQILDVIAAIEFISQEAKQYRIDIDNIFISGDSAGAYLAAMIGCITTDQQLQKYFQWKTSVKIRAIAANCGMYDFETYMQKEVKFPMKKGIVEMLFGTKHYLEEEAFAYSSVLKHINEKFPPVYLMDTQKQSFELEALRLQEKVKEQGIECKLHIYDRRLNLMHAFNILSKYPQSAEVLYEIFTFFNAHRK